MRLVEEGLHKKKTECIIVASQDQALSTRNMRSVFYGENIQSISHLSCMWCC